MLHNTIFTVNSKRYQEISPPEGVIFLLLNSDTNHADPLIHHCQSQVLQVFVPGHESSTLEKAMARSAASYSAAEVTVLIPRSNTKFLP